MPYLRLLQPGVSRPCGYHVLRQRNPANQRVCGIFFVQNFTGMRLTIMAASRPMTIPASVPESTRKGA